MSEVPLTSMVSPLDGKSGCRQHWTSHSRLLSQRASLSKIISPDGRLSWPHRPPVQPGHREMGAHDAPPPNRRSGCRHRWPHYLKLTLPAVNRGFTFALRNGSSRCPPPELQIGLQASVAARLAKSLETCHADYLRILVYLVIYDSGQVSLEHLLLWWYPSLPTLSLITPGRQIGLQASLAARLAKSLDADGDGNVIYTDFVKMFYPQPSTLQRLLFYCRTTSASTAPRTPRSTCCHYAYVLITEL